MERRSLLQWILFAPLAAWFGVSKPEPHLHTWRFDTNICRECGVTLQEFLEGSSYWNTDKSWLPKTFRVETLEHEGWGIREPENNHGQSRYVTQATFDTKEQAEAFVCSLYPQLLRVEVYDIPMTDQLRSGYRGAVRAQFNGGVRSTEFMLVSKQKDGTFKPVFTHHPCFWDASNAWAYLACIRINGEPVSRPSRPGSSLSEYLVQPFMKGNPEIVKVPWHG